jgi:hypothetical protein
VTTFVQQLDAQGPVVVERVSTQFADVACTPANARMLLEGLHNGTSITLNADGKTASFTPTAQLGYGDAYIALALAAEALRNAGVTGCATPDQWKAVLLGGPLAAAGTTSTTTSRSATASSSSRFPGILTLHSQGQGWGQVAQTTNVQLGQVVSNARSSFSMNSMNSRDNTNLSPTGRTSSDKAHSSSAHPSADKNDKNSSSASATGDITPSSDQTGRGKGKGKDHDKSDKDQGAGAGAGSSNPDSSTSSKP